MNFFLLLKNTIIHPFSRLPALLLNGSKFIADFLFYKEKYTHPFCNILFNRFD